MAPPRKYISGCFRIEVKLDSDIAGELMEMSQRTNRTKTSIITDAIKIYIVQHTGQQQNTDPLLEFMKLDLNYEILNMFKNFNSIKFSGFASAKNWTKRLMLYSQKARKYSLDNEILDAIDLRLQFLYKTVLPDVYHELYIGDVKISDPLWYDFEAFWNNGCKRPPKPKEWHMSPDARQRYLESKRAAEHYGIRNNNQLVIDRSEPDYLLLEDAQYNKLLEEAEREASA